MAELENVALLIVMLTVMCFVIKIYSVAVKAACERIIAFQVWEMEEEQRDFHVRVLNMEREQTARHLKADLRRAVRRYGTRGTRDCQSEDCQE